MTRIHDITATLSVWVYTDHAPPHFHIRSTKSNALISLRTLQVMRGRYDPREFAAVVAWASIPENRAVLTAEWERLNGKD